jgi:hypothetical protein
MGTPGQAARIRLFGSYPRPGMVSKKVPIRLLFGASMCYSTPSIEDSQGRMTAGNAASLKGCTAVLGSPCEGEGRGFETRVPLQRAHHLSICNDRTASLYRYLLDATPGQHPSPPSLPNRSHCAALHMTADESFANRSATSSRHSRESSLPLKAHKSLRTR